MGDAPSGGDTPTTPEWAPPAANAPTNGKAIAALVLGILACCALGPLTGVPALILGILANKEVQAGGFSEGSKAMAIAGIVLGAIGTLFGIIWIFTFFVGGGLQGFIDDFCEENPEDEACQDQPAVARDTLAPVAGRGEDAWAWAGQPLMLRWAPWPGST
ncbi:MAG: DUF4190 domain-containing protein [Thermoplasmatota archaeon]